MNNHVTLHPFMSSYLQRLPADYMSLQFPGIGTFFTEDFHIQVLQADVTHPFDCDTPYLGTVCTDVHLQSLSFADDA